MIGAKASKRAGFLWLNPAAGFEDRGLGGDPHRLDERDRDVLILEYKRDLGAARDYGLSSSLDETAGDLQHEFSRTAFAEPGLDPPPPEDRFHNHDLFFLRWRDGFH